MQAWQASLQNETNCNLQQRLRATSLVCTAPHCSWDRPGSAAPAQGRSTRRSILPARACRPARHELVRCQDLFAVSSLSPPRAYQHGGPTASPSHNSSQHTQQTHCCESGHEYPGCPNSPVPRARVKPGRRGPAAMMGDPAVKLAASGPCKTTGWVQVMMEGGCRCENQLNAKLPPNFTHGRPGPSPSSRKPP